MPKKISNTQILLRFVLAFPVYLAIFFWPAGTLKWIEGWIYIAIYFIYAILIGSWLKKNNPQLLEDRLKFMKGSAKTWDKVWVIATTPIFISIFIIPGLDAVRFQWTYVPLYLKIIGFAIMPISLYFVFLVMKENTFLSRVVEIQKEKGHKVITTGPYKYIRHPMYSAVTVLILCTPIALGSLWSYIPVVLSIILIVIRTYLEDKTLQKELEGYKEYTKKTPYRLLPGIW